MLTVRLTTTTGGAGDFLQNQALRLLRAYREQGRLVVAITRPAAEWYDHALVKIGEARQALADFDSLNLPKDDPTVASTRAFLVATLEEYERDAAYWQGQLQAS